MRDEDRGPVCSLSTWIGSEVSHVYFAHWEVFNLGPLKCCLHDHNSTLCWLTAQEGGAAPLSTSLGSPPRVQDRTGADSE